MPQVRLKPTTSVWIARGHCDRQYHLPPRANNKRILPSRDSIRNYFLTHVTATNDSTTYISLLQNNCYIRIYILISKELIRFQLFRILIITILRFRSLSNTSICANILCHVLVSGEWAWGASDGPSTCSGVWRGVFTGAQLPTELRQELQSWWRFDHSCGGARPQRSAPVHLLHGCAMGNRQQAPSSRRDKVLLVQLCSMRGPDRVRNLLQRNSLSRQVRNHF
jgi:hypothetical protein